MKWFDVWFERKCIEALENATKKNEPKLRENKVYALSTNDRIDSVREEEINLRDSLRISVLSARGGTVMQIHKFNEKMGENKTHTYVIGDEEPLNERIAQIISMEIIAR